MGSYRVTAPFITLKVKDFSGSTVVQGFYLDGVVQDPIEDEQFAKHVRNGWVEKTATAPVVQEPVTGDEAPKGNASREDWAVFAAIKGAPNEETRPVEEGGLRQTELRDKYGN